MPSESTEFQGVPGGGVEVVVGVLRDQVVSPDLVGRQHEFASIDDIPGCLCCVGGGGGVWSHTWRTRRTFPDARDLYALQSTPVIGFWRGGNVWLEGPTWTGGRAA